MHEHTLGSSVENRKLWGPPVPMFEEVNLVMTCIVEAALVY